MTTSSKSPNSLKTVLIKLKGIKEYLGAPSMSHTETLQRYNKNITRKSEEVYFDFFKIMDDIMKENIADLEIEEEEVLTAENALEAIENAWLNEKFSPEILPHKFDLVDCMLQQISHMEENMKRLERDDLRLVVHRMELDRIRFLISSYLRIRLEKIERYTIHILSEEASREPDEAYLTPEELRFAKDYLGSIENLFKTVALQHMPTNFQGFEIDKVSTKPNMQTHVFLRANERITGIVLPGVIDEEIDFEAGSQHIIQYNAIANLVKSGAVQLI
ncbi:DNA replication complex GINS protein SLD5 isoform X1 [Vespa crabro]|uniref:DNA replication complex GINS protein SLD5 isoform X1 n=1 Tax=Vespa crabro TaxID=7445 RepID=UPI001F0223F4|nr:DNA replication complex GINS protein SLD5 isoform X1 [Vespa crabro]